MLQEPLLVKTAKRLLKAVKAGKTSLYEVVIEGGGSIPKDLSGRYTSFKGASLAILMYNACKEAEEANKRPYHKGRDYGNKDKVRG